MTFRRGFKSIIALLVLVVIAVCAGLFWSIRHAKGELDQSNLAYEGHYAGLKLAKEHSQYGSELMHVEPERVPRRRAAEALCDRLLKEIRDKTQYEIELIDSEEEKGEEVEEAAVVQSIAIAFESVKSKVRAAEEAAHRGEPEIYRARIRDALVTLEGELEPRLNAYAEDEVQQAKERAGKAHVTVTRWLVASSLIIVLSTLLVATVTILLLRRMKRGIETLTTGTRELAKGNLGFRLKASGFDELSGLAEDFDRMSAQIDELHSQLDERTTRIEQAYSFQKEFFSMMTHELRAPLNSVLGFCELIRDEEASLGQLARGNLQWIEASAHRMMERVNTILMLAKLEAEKLEVNAQPFALRPLIEDVVRELKGHIKVLGRDVCVTLEIGEDAPASITSDEEKLRHILVNLTSNAAKFTERGTITIRVAKAGEGRLSVAVSDTGVGIPEDRLDAIFELYTVGVWRGSGSGIGLALARRFARLLHGDISVTSKLKEGSTFTLVLEERIESENGSGGAE